MSAPLLAASPGENTLTWLREGRRGNEGREGRSKGRGEVRGEEG